LSGPLAGRVVLLTGAAGGFGQAIAEAFRKEGAELGLVVRRRGQLPPEAGLVIVADLADPAAPGGIVAAVIERFGRLDVLVNNAGVAPRLGLDNATPEAWRAAFAVNLDAAMFLTQAAAPHLARTGGSIVNIASEMGRRASPASIAYSVSKAALIQLTRCAALALAGDGVRVNAIAPGPVDTPMLRHSIAQRGIDLEEGLAGYRSRVPSRRLGSVDEVARAVLYVASPDAAYMTGAVLAIDGGTTAGEA
jgi:NAD(P)-dependent dehydrogenase (short-subunit alcohol dehydrogenase family)